MCNLAFAQAYPDHSSENICLWRVEYAVRLGHPRTAGASKPFVCDAFQA